MKVMWCWRCRQDVPMLDEDEYRAIYVLPTECFRRAVRERGNFPDEKRPSVYDFLEPVSEEYERMTGMKGCHPNAIIYHRISTYGPPCPNCGKPLRTPRARFCAACGFVVDKSWSKY